MSVIVIIFIDFPYAVEGDHLSYQTTVIGPVIPDGIVPDSVFELINAITQIETAEYRRPIILDVGESPVEAVHDRVITKPALHPAIVFLFDKICVVEL